jgi:hypothetical protein
MRTILQYIANDTKLVEIASTTLCAKRFFKSDLNITNGVLIPTSPHCDIGETKDKQIFDHFFTKVMVNPESFILGPILFDGRQQAASRIKILPERFFNDDAIDPSYSNVTVLLEIFGHRDEYAWWKGEVEDAVAFFGLVTGFDFFEMLVEYIKSSAIFVIPGNVCGDILELLQGSGGVIIIRQLDVGDLVFEEVLMTHLGSCIPNDFQILWEKALTVETEKRREGLDIGVQSRRQHGEYRKALSTFFLARSPDAPRTI